MTDYDTYKEIMEELINPIIDEGVDVDTLKRLYESKAVYLENLRIKCFREINGRKETYFTEDDYLLILEAISRNRAYLRSLILFAVSERLSRKSNFG